MCSDLYLSYHPWFARRASALEWMLQVLCFVMNFLCSDIPEAFLATGCDGLLCYFSARIFLIRVVHRTDIALSGEMWFLSRAVKFTANHLMHQSRESLHMSKMGFRDVTAKYFNPCPAGIESGACGPLNSLC